MPAEPSFLSTRCKAAIMLLRSTTASISCVALGGLFSFLAGVLDAFSGLTRRFRPLLLPGNLGSSSLFVGISFTLETKVPLLYDSFGPSVRSNSYLLCPRLTSAHPSHRLATILAPRVFSFPASQIGRSPRVRCRTFTLMTVASTSTLSGSVSGFNASCRLTQRTRLMRFLFVGPALCLRLPSDPTSRWTPLPFGLQFP